MSKIDRFKEVAVETTFRVRYAETDQMGIVHHSAYIVWLEEGRSQWMRANGSSYVEFEADGLALSVIELHLRYERPAKYDQLVTVRCRLDEVRSRQMQYSYEVLNAETGEIFASGYSKHVCINRAGKAAKIPDSWRQRLAGTIVAG
ncbi:MAG TPA: thioesterase family protein [Anaerolineae bacterium]|nr:thioesterase family protein [Anaerolineae bacterium]HMR63153.1 thioesterase family protein [Anaerolineae bacterium]